MDPTRCSYVSAINGRQCCGPVNHPELGHLIADTDEEEARLLERVNQARLEADELMYGIAIVDEDGKRIDPRLVELPEEDA